VLLVISRRARLNEEKITVNYVIPPAAVVSLPITGTDQCFPVRRVYCVGRNYVEHAIEMGFTGREAPFFFLKPADAVIACPAGVTTDIAYPSLTKNYHHEVELVVAIGTGGKNIKAADAAKHIYGYAVGLDMTRRDLQGESKKTGRPWEIGKAVDQSAPTGPITPITQSGEINSGAITLTVNGKTTQSSDIDKLIWNVSEIIEHLSAAWELQAGDLIMTGTPEGVAAVVAGDVMAASCAGVEAITVRVV
jgi:fumarylpyruvate hydrolase